MITRFIALYIALSTVSLNLLQIYGTSTSSYGKKVSSTYQRYASGTFLPNSLYLYRLFAKDLRQGVQNGQGCRWFHAVTSLCSKLAGKNVHGCTFQNRHGWR